MAACSWLQNKQMSVMPVNCLYNMVNCHHFLFLESLDDLSLAEKCVPVSDLVSLESLTIMVHSHGNSAYKVQHACSLQH